MKIIYCISGVYNSGGMERVLMAKTNYLAEILGYQVMIITTDQRGRLPFFSYSPKISFFDLNINYDKSRNRNICSKIIIRGIKKIIHKKRLSELLQKEAPDICVSMFDWDFSFLYKIKDGSRKIVEYHFSKNYKLIEAKNIIIYWLQKKRIEKWRSIVAKYDAFVVLTEEDKEAWGELNNIRVIPNPIIKMPPNVSTLSTKCVIAVGRLSYQKGFDLLIRAWEIVHTSFNDWQLCIIGNGEKEKELKELIENLQLSDSVYLKKATKDIAKEYLESSIYAMSSRYEGFPMVLLEAISYGLPIVSFSCPCGPQELIKGTFGSLVPVGDINSFAKELMYWMEDKEKREKAKVVARQYASIYLLPDIMKKWEDLFYSLPLGKK